MAISKSSNYIFNQILSHAFAHVSKANETDIGQRWRCWNMKWLIIFALRNENESVPENCLAKREPLNDTRWNILALKVYDSKKQYWIEKLINLASKL